MIKIKYEIRDNHITLEGYVNVTNRNSRILSDKTGSFVEQMVSGVFKRALRKKPNIPMLLNHKWDKVLAHNGDGNLRLWEDNIGLKYSLRTDNEEVIQLAKEGRLQGCSFAFSSLKETFDKLKNGMKLRFVEDIELFECSILSVTPAYEGSSAELRSEDVEVQLEIREFDIEQPIEEVPAEVIEQELEEKEVELEVQEQEIQTQEEIIKETIEPAPEMEQELQEEKVNYTIETQEFYKMWLYLQKNK